jgi:hypothetical protein
LAGKCLGVVDGDFHFQRSEVGAAQAFGHARRFGQWVAPHIEPQIVAETDGLDHQRVVFPVRHRVAVPGWLRIFGQRAAVEEDLAVAGVKFIEDRDHAG